MASRVARFFLVYIWYQNRKNVPNEHKMHQMVINIPNVRKIFQMAIKYINIFQSFSKIYPSWDFWFEKKPSGNPDGQYLPSP
jgi:hypothetical protein